MNGNPDREQDEDEAAITRTTNAYFGGLYTSDVALLKSIFRSDAAIIGYDSAGTLQTMSRDTFLSFVETVPSPKDAGVAYDMEILSIDYTPTTAAVVVHDAYIKRDFIDYLLMVKDGEDWIIAAKMFHSEAQADLA